MMTPDETKELSELRLQSEQRLQAENAQLRDFARNVAGLDDRLIRNTDILKQWRDDARALCAKMVLTGENDPHKSHRPLTAVEIEEINAKLRASAESDC